MKDLKFVMETLRKKEAREKLSVIRMEIDYELVTLYDAMKQKDTVAIIKSKERLINLRRQWLEMEDQK